MLYVIAKAAIGSAPFAPPLGLWMGLAGLYIAGLVGFSAFVISGDWRKHFS